MPVPFGFGVGDFVAVGTLAWNVYKSSAPESFGDISIEVLSLHAMLKAGEESLLTRPLPPARAEKLKIVKEGCEKVLVDLQSLVEKYQSLGTQSKRTWDRMRWGNENITEIRARLTSNISTLTAFISTSQVSVETKLDKFIEEFRQGRIEGSVVSLQTVDSLSADDRTVWRTIRKELEEIGISVAAFDANRNSIFDWFVRAVETGAFEEQNEYGIDEESGNSDEQDLQSKIKQGGHDTERQTEHFESESLGSISEDQAFPRPHSSGSPPDAGPSVPKRGPKTFDQTFASTPIARKHRKPVPSVAAFLAGISPVDAGDVSRALKILKDEASFQLLDSKTLDKALWSVTSQFGSSESLLTELIARGANVNYISSDSRERTPLWNCVESGSLVAEIDAVSPKHGTALMLALSKGEEDAAKFLLDKGADPNFGAASNITYRTLVGEKYHSPIEAAIIGGNPLMVKILLSCGVVLVDSTVRFAHQMVRSATGKREDDWEVLRMLENMIPGVEKIDSPKKALSAGRGLQPPSQIKEERLTEEIESTRRMHLSLPRK